MLSRTSSGLHKLCVQTWLGHCSRHKMWTLSHSSATPECCRQIHSCQRTRMFWKIPSKENGEKVYPALKCHDGSSLLDRYIFVKTLINYFEDIPDGIILDCSYADSRPNEDFNPVVPVVVGLHDTPGTHHDLTPILNVLAKLGCRTIAPTFPGHGDTLGLVSGYDDVFSHSTMERAIFVEDFLQDLQIDRVDLLIGVGAGCYPTLRLCAGADTTTEYRSMALISPWPLQRPRYEPNPNVVRHIQQLWEHPLMRPSVQLFLPSFDFGQAHSTRDKVTGAYLLGNLDLGEAGGLALAASAMNLPSVVMFGERDPAVEQELYYDVLDCLEIPRSNVTVFKGKHETPLLPGGLVFPNGGYDLHTQHAGVISAFLLNIVQLFHPHIRI